LVLNCCEGIPYEYRPAFAKTSLRNLYVPDGTRVAVESSTAGNRDIWTLNFQRMTLTQLASGPGEDLLAVWTPDSSRMYFGSGSGEAVARFEVFSPVSGREGRREQISLKGRTLSALVAVGEGAVLHHAGR